MITVKFNDESLLLDDGATVSCMLGKKNISAVNISAVNIAVAVNGQMVPKTEYDATALHDGDTVLVIKAFYGG